MEFEVVILCRNRECVTVHTDADSTRIQKGNSTHKFTSIHGASQFSGCMMSNFSGRSDECSGSVRVTSEPPCRAYITRRQTLLRVCRWPSLRSHSSRKQCGGCPIRPIVLDSKYGGSVKEFPLRHLLWFGLAGALAFFALAIATTPALAQSQAPSNPPCSDEPPTLKRDAQPSLPPCPEPAHDDSGSVDSASIPSLPPSAPLIERARVAALQFSQKLPNFICQEFMARFTQQGRGQKVPQDIVSAEIIYEDGKETYRNVKVNNRPTNKQLKDIDGAWSTGEFASALLDLFDPASKAHFSPGRASAASGIPAQVYDFQVQAANSHWRLSVASQSGEVVTDYTGSIWVDPSTARVLRIESQARNIPSDFPIDTVESAIDYSYVMIEGKSFLLPVHAESLGCQRGSSFCTHNIIDFRNYHEFTASGKILP